MAIVPSSTEGTLDAAQEAVTVLCADADHIAVQLSGTFTATAAFECSVDGSNWVALALKASSQTAEATLVTTSTSAGVFSIPTEAIPHFRVRCSAYTDGAIVATVRLSRINK